MPKPKLPHATAWRERDIKNWNTTTFRSYLSDKHYELYQLSYVPYRGYQAEAGMIKRMIDEHGTEITKLFIDACFKEYKPTKDYPSTNFGFMYSFQRGRLLQPIVNEMKNKQLQEQRKSKTTMTLEEIEDFI